MIYTGNTVVKNRRRRGEKENPTELPRDVQYYLRARILLRNFPHLNTQIQGIYREFCHFYPWFFDALTVANTGISRFSPPLAHKKAQNLTGNFIHHRQYMDKWNYFLY